MTPDRFALWFRLFGCFGLFIGIAFYLRYALRSRSVLFPSGLSRSAITRDQNPGFYWVLVAFWFGLDVLSLVAGCRLVLRLMSS